MNQQFYTILILVLGNGASISPFAANGKRTIIMAATNMLKIICNYDLYVFKVNGYGVVRCVQHIECPADGDTV